MIDFNVVKFFFFLFSFLPASDILSFSQYCLLVRYLETSLENETNLHVNVNLDDVEREITHSTHAPLRDEEWDGVNSIIPQQ